MGELIPIEDPAEALQSKLERLEKLRAAARA